MLAAPSFWRSNIPRNQQAARWPAPGTALAATSTLINLFFAAFQLSRWLVLGLTACGCLQNGQKQAQGPFSGSGGGVGRVGRESARYRHQRAALVSITGAFAPYPANPTTRARKRPLCLFLAVLEASAGC